MPSEEQSAASEALNVGLERWVTSLPYRGGECGGIGVLGDWIAVVCMVDVNDEGQPVAQYYLVMKSGVTLPHIAEGLLRQGLAELSRNTVNDED